MDTVKLYHRGAVELLGIGLCGPDLPADVPAGTAEAWLRDNPRDWSRTPFASAPSEPAERPAARRRKKETTA